MIQTMQETTTGIDEKLDSSSIPILAPGTRVRRPVVFDQKEEEQKDEKEEEIGEEEEEEDMQVEKEEEGDEEVE